MVEPYNSVLHCHYSIEHCDVSFLVDNQVILRKVRVAIWPFSKLFERKNELAY